MAVYTVLLPPPGLVSGPEETAERTVFVRDGFAWLAMLFPVLWLLFNRLWLLTLAFVVAAAVLEGAMSLLGGPAPGLAGFALAVLFGFEANGLKRWALMRRGYRLAGIVAGSRRADCERRFFAHWLDEGGFSAGPAPMRLPAAPAAGGAVPRTPAVAVAPARRAQGDPGIVGLFPETRSAR